MVEKWKLLQSNYLKQIGKSIHYKNWKKQNKRKYSQSTFMMKTNQTIQNFH